MVMMWSTYNTGFEYMVRRFKGFLLELFHERHNGEPLVSDPLVFET